MRALRLSLAVLLVAGPVLAADPAEPLCECAKTAVACGGPVCTCAKVREGEQCPLHRGAKAKAETKAKDAKAAAPAPAKSEAAKSKP
jgi:hypothetical protein